MKRAGFGNLHRAISGASAFFDDKDRYKFIKKEFSHYLRAYRKIKHGAVKADLWRYLIIYKYGGVYADIDSKCIVSLREWINPRSLWVTHLGVNRDVCQWPIMTVPENPIFKRAAEKSYEFKVGSSHRLEVCEGIP